jgi:hypothetical protein
MIAIGPQNMRVKKYLNKVQKNQKNNTGSGIIYAHAGNRDF